MSDDVPRTSEQYRRWWFENAPVPYGYCWCGCGQKTKIAPQNRKDTGWVDGEPRRFLRGHQFKVGPGRQAPKPNPSGFCWCGCGQKTEPAQHTDPLIGWVKGEPKRYLPGHLNASRAAWATDEQKDEICCRYEAGEGSYALAREFGVSGSNLGRMLDQRGIKRRSASETLRTRDCDHSFFDVIDTEEKAYWLGFLAADSCVVEHATKTFVVRLALASKDRDHLLKYRSAIKSTHAIIDYTTKSGHGGNSLAIASPELAEGLAKHDIAPRKTFTHEWPGDLLPDHLLRHYLRGYFDGDGGFNLRCKPDEAPKLLWTIVGNEAFCLGAQTYLMDTLGLHKTKLYVPKNSPNIRKLSYSGRRQVSRIYHLLYKDATIYLPRKREQVRPYVHSPFESEPAIPDGETLRRLRKDRGMTAVELAAKAGSSPRTISEVETGKLHKVRFSTICNIASALSVEPEVLAPRN